MKLTPPLLAALFWTAVLFAQEPSTEVIIQGSAKVGNLITGTGNTINVTQTILPKSQDYAILREDSTRLKKILDEKNSELSKATGNSALEEYIRKDRDQRAEEYQAACRVLADFKEDVQRLAETFNKIPINSERLRTAKALFDEGKIREADAVLKTQEMEKETDALLLKGERLRHKVAENDSLRIVKSSEWLIKAQITKTRYELTDWFDSTDYYFRRSIECHSGVSNEFDYAFFLQEQNKIDSAMTHYRIASKNCIADGKKGQTWLAAQNNLGNLYRFKNDYLNAEKTLSLVLKNYQNLAITNPKVYEPYVAGAQNNLGVLFREKNDYDRADSMFSSALEIYRRYAKDSPKTYEPEVANVQNNLAQLYRDKNDYPNAEAALLSALGIYRHYAKDDPETYEPQVAGVLNNLAMLYSDLRQDDKCLKMLTDALEIRQGLAKINPQSQEPEVAGILNNLGMQYCYIRKYVEAEAALLSSLSIRQRYAKAAPSYYEPSVAQTLTNIGMLFSDMGRYDSAEVALNSALLIYQRYVENNPQVYEPQIALVNFNLGALYFLMGNYTKAKLSLLSALQIRSKYAAINANAYETDVAQVQTCLGSLYIDENDLENAEAVLVPASEVYERYAKENPQTYLSSLADVRSKLGDLYRFKNEFPNAEKSFLSALEIYVRYAKDNPTVYDLKIATVLTGLGYLYGEEDNFPKAVKSLLAALEIFERYRAIVKNESCEQDITAIQSKLGALFSMTGQYEDAVRYLTIALPAQEKLFEKYPDGYLASLAYTHNNLGFALLKLEKMEDAKLHLEKSQSLKPKNSWVYRNWACYYSMLNDLPESILSLEKAAGFGYDEPEWIEKEPLLGVLRGQKGYSAALEKIRQNAKEK